MTRNRSLPWIYRRSRWLIGAIALLGILLTSYLTFLKVTGDRALCLAGGDGCNTALSSSYATVFGLPLSLYGLLAYSLMAVFAFLPFIASRENNKQWRDRLEGWTWNLLLVGATVMTAASSYLVYILTFELQVFCPYCTASAIFSLSLLILTLFGRLWEDWGQVAFTGLIVAVVTVAGTLGVYANEAPPALIDGRMPIPALKSPPKPGEGWEIVTQSGNAEIALAEHLRQKGAKMYGAYWCPHCSEQKLLFGKGAFSKIDYVECDGRGKNPRVQLCQEAEIKGFPTWEIEGQFYQGIQSLDTLAKISDYDGSANFQYILPGLQ